MGAKTYIIEIPITTDCDPSVLLDLATEMSGQVAEEATEYGTGDVDATVDDDEVSVRPAGLTSLERELLDALQLMTAYEALNTDGCISDEECKHAETLLTMKDRVAATNRARAVIATAK